MKKNKYRYARAEFITNKNGDIVNTTVYFKTLEDANSFENDKKFKNKNIFTVERIGTF